MGEVLLLPEVINVELLTTHASPKKDLFFQETEFVFLKASLSYLGTIVAVSFYLGTFYANLFCRETFSVGFGAPMIVTMELGVICFPSNLAICYAHKGLSFDFAPRAQVAISTSDGSGLLSDENLSSLLPLLFVSHLGVFSVHLQAAANHAVPDQRSTLVLSYVC